MELFKDREKQKQIKKESKKTLIIVVGFFVVFVSAFIYGMFDSLSILAIIPIIYIIFKLYKGYKSIKNRYDESFEKLPSIELFKGILYKQTINIIEELKILYSINEEITTKIIDTDFIEYRYDNFNNRLFLTKGFIHFFKRGEKTYILQRAMYFEKTNTLTAHEITQKMQENKRKYGNKLGDEICYHHLDNLEQTFGIIERLNKIKIKGSVHTYNAIIAGLQENKLDIEKEKELKKPEEQIKKMIKNITGKDIKEFNDIKNKKDILGIQKIKNIFMLIVFSIIGISFLFEFLNK